MNELERALINRIAELEAHVREVEQGNLVLQAELERERARYASQLGCEGPAERPA